MTGSVSGKTNFLVVGKQPGASKVSKARASGKVKLVNLHDLSEGKFFCNFFFGVILQNNIFLLHCQSCQSYIYITLFIVSSCFLLFPQVFIPMRWKI